MYSGGQERMAMAVNRYTHHEAKCLAPGIWWDPQRKHLFGHNEKSSGFIYNVNIPEVKNAILESSDVIACMYTCSLHSLGRRDLLKKKICTWHLAIRWKQGMYEAHFPGDDIKKYRLLLSLEGWDRYNLDKLPFTIIPVIFNIEEPEFVPIPFEKRQKYVSMAPRTRTSMDTDSSPRFANKVSGALSGVPFKVIYHKSFLECMDLKKQSWVGVDDLINPLTHLSGFEYCSVGVPCFSRVDEHLQRSFSEHLGCESLPFIDACLKKIRKKAKWALGQETEEWKAKSIEVRKWMEKYYHPRDAIRRYIEIYERS
jgi:hypothetical protein